MSMSIPFYGDPSVIYLVTEDMTPEQKYKYMDNVEWQSITTAMQHYLNTFDLCIATEDQENNRPRGFHSGTITAKQWFKDVFHLLHRVTNRVYKLGRTLVEKVTKKYTIITKLWEGTLQRNMDKINDEHFTNTVVKCISNNTLKKRIEVIGSIQDIISKVKSIVEGPIQNVDDENAYSTPEFTNCYKAIQEIGLTIKNKTFTESQSEGYKDQTKKDTIGKLGYDKSTLPELINIAKSIAQVATSKWVKSTTVLFKQLNDGLINREKSTLENKNLNDTQKKIELKKIKIRISRLWWISNYIHLLNELADDCIQYILIVFRAADSSIPLATNHESDEKGGNKYYF